ncbi:hypothetical protein IAG25_26810 [Caballeronia sp. EK]|uniref:hypothetical protein n=1 Tax=Caballeronia sp. EK TaxID=2767469 RepID=UPI0016556621|nr:hypothetical protein [Caballeronia sp. EK]MBC8640451.1 hypothetical protein [Caballeronia sp. EK]
MNRDSINKIKKKKERSIRTGKPGLAEMWDIERLLSGHAYGSEIENSLSIAGMAACLEVSVRNSIRKLIDHGEPYLDRTGDFSEQMKFDFRLTRALSEREISFGEYVSHLLPISSFSQIVSYLNVLLGGSKKSGAIKSALSNIKGFEEIDTDDLSQYDSFEEDTYSGFGLNDFSFWPVTLPILNLNDLLRDIEKIFQLRHIVVHEANFSLVNSKQLDPLILSARTFMLALYEITEQLINPGVPRSPVRLSFFEARRAEEMHSEIISSQSEILRILASKGSESFSQIALFLLAQNAFSAFVSAEAEFRALSCLDFRRATRRSIDARLKSEFYERRLAYLRELKGAITAPDDLLL